jgi:phosphatidylinositol alpha-mannosyltransferase
MRIALVSPYSWTYPGGVARHVGALAEHLIAAGHDARILAPFDPDDALSRRLHRGVAPEARESPAHLVELGRTIGLPANGAVSNVALSPAAVFRMRDELHGGGYDVVHIHEPIVPAISWDAVTATALPLVGTFHTYSTNRLTNNLGNFAGASRRFHRLHVRIAVSGAARWTAERFFGGRYRVIPNGVEVLTSVARTAAVAPTSERPLRVAFVGQAVERKGLPVALAAFAALREHVPARLDVVGVEHSQLAGLIADAAGIVAHGRVGDGRKLEVLAAADLLVAPSLGGESFGMVLTEAFAAATPVVASDIPGYGEVVSDGLDGVLVPRGDAQALAATLLALAHDPGRREAMSRAASVSAARYAWPRVTEQVLEAYEDARRVRAPDGVRARLAVRAGVRPADGLPRVAAKRRLPGLERDERTRAVHAAAVTPAVGELPEPALDPRA